MAIIQPCLPPPKCFNTAGPINPADHYALDPLARLDYHDLRQLIDQKKYFVLHAPRQTGKTSALLALADRLNAESDYRALYVNVEAAQAFRDKVFESMHTMSRALAQAANDTLNDPQPFAVLKTLLAEGSPTLFGELLTRWCAQLDRPLVLLLDEVDALVGDTLISLLRQLRAGYTQRPARFPHSHQRARHHHPHRNGLRAHHHRVGDVKRRTWPSI